jgi:aspartate aminotransferase
VGNGAKPLLHNIFMTLLDPGDEVVLPTPCWTSHMGMLQVLGAQVKTVECTLDNDFKPRPVDLRAAITEKTRLLILCSPGNPTGALLNESDLRAIANIMTEHPEVWIVSDEIYSDIVFDSRRHASFAVVAPELADRIITVNGMSKSYAMTGWRIGYAAGPTQAITGTSNLMSQITGSPSSIGQAAAIAALDGPQEPILRRNTEYQSRRDMVCEYLSRVPELVISKPAGAFYIFVDSAGAVGR